jgi:hypothetical protein
MRSICIITLFFRWHLNLAESFHCVFYLGNFNHAIYQTSSKLTLWNAKNSYYVASSQFISWNGNVKDNTEVGNNSIDGNGGNQEEEKSKCQIIQFILQIMRENIPL